VWGIELAIMAVMICINSLFAAYEIALASVGLGRLEALAQQHRRGATAAVRMKKRMEGSLAVVQLGITLVGVIAAATGGAGAEESIEPVLRDMGLSGSTAQFIALLLVVAPLTALTIIFGELVPKVFALRNKDWVVTSLSPLMEWFSLAVWPAVWVLEKSAAVIVRWSEIRWKPAEGETHESDEATLHELRVLANLARTSRLIGTQEEGIIVNAARLSRTPIHTIMMPAAYISMLNATDSLADCLIAAHKDMHTRFPVTERTDDPQSIIGYANFKDIVACMRMSPEDPSIRAIVRPLPAFEANQSVAACLEHMTRDRTHIALVKNEAREIIGMFTLEDILEELVGEIHDEYDRLPHHIVRSGRGWIVGGQASLLQLRDVSGINLVATGNEESPATLNEWIAQQLDEPVQGGEIVQADTARVVVRKVRRQLVMEAYILPRQQTAMS
jgi:putative hemolysin